MAKYDIRYSETYSDTYTVEAGSYEEATKELFRKIVNGLLDGPVTCVDTNYEDATKECPKSPKLGRVIHIRNEYGTEDKYVTLGEKGNYKGHRIYQERCPSGYYKSQSWLVVCDSDSQILVIQSYNHLSLEELYDAIDDKEETGKYGYSAIRDKNIVNKQSMDVYTVHNCGEVRI